MALRIEEEARVFGGRQLTLSHDSTATGTVMRLAVFVPPRPTGAALLWLSGLTCTEANFTQKAGAQRRAAERGLTLIAPDTSPRGEGVADDEAYDLGQGAGFYVDATQAPWAPHYRMRAYVEAELIGLVARDYPAERVGVSGHSMGGHGALTVALRDPAKWGSASALAPIVAPTAVPWGRKALTAYLGPDEEAWAPYDACRLVEGGARVPELLIDQGTADAFLDEQLRPELFEAACEGTGIDLTLRRQKGYDHSYFFVASVIDDHVDWHADRLG